MSVQRHKILVVDDSEICRDTAKVMLTELGFEVITLDTPLGFSSNLMAHQPDIALVDVSMPALQGNQLVDIARRRGMSAICPILLFSSRPRDELKQLVMQCGADGFISKSEDWPIISRAILNFIRQTR